MTVFVGVDQALTKMGVVVIQDGTVSQLELIRPPDHLVDTDRLVHLDNCLRAILAPLPPVTQACLEGQSYNSTGQTDQLGQIAGVVKVALHEASLRSPVAVPPATLKKFVTGRGAADKAQMMRATSKKWGIEITQDDICDAHGLARIAEQLHCLTTTTRHEAEAIISLTQPKKRRRRVKKLFPKDM